MDERLIEFLQRHPQSDSARVELEELFQLAAEERELPDTPEPANQAEWSSELQVSKEAPPFDPMQTLNDPDAGRALRDALDARLLEDDDSTTNPVLMPLPQKPPTDTQTEHSLPPFQAIENELDAWAEDSQEPASEPELSRSPSLSGESVAPDGAHFPMKAMPPGERYEDLGLLGLGGMGEVRKVRDKQLKRVVAMKVIRKGLEDDFSLSIRFIEEAQATAQLQHPGIIPLHDLGQLPDGRYFFTMKEIKGKTLEEVIRSMHEISRPLGRWTKTDDGWTIRRIIDAFRDVCEAVGYAHSRNVIHRDLKPENVMLGAHGEVLVLDWGLVKVQGRAATQHTGDFRRETMDVVVTDRSLEEEYVTMIGAVTGTPTYMSPEQAMGAANLDARTDVYALGAVLYEILSGRPPYYGDDQDAVLNQLLKGPPPQLQTQAEKDLESTWERARSLEPQLPLPEVLVEICNKAMAREARDRYPNATELAHAVDQWLDGDQKRERALQLIDEANEKLVEMDGLREQAKKLREKAAALLETVEAWEPEASKQRGWSIQDEAQRLEREANLRALEIELRLQGALVHDPFLVEARAALAASYQRLHHEAERLENEHERIRAEQMLFNHVQAIPPTHPDFKKYLMYLKGDGALTLYTEPADAEVILYRYVEQNRRLVPVRGRSLGRTPLRKVSLPMGSYLLLLRKEGHAEVRYPVHIQRQEHWDCIPPGEQEPHVLRLPKAEQLQAHECFVPDGWFWSGGDPDAPNALPKRRLWLDGFVIKRFPTTHEEYLQFLNALLQESRALEAENHVPRFSDLEGSEGYLYGRSHDGLFVPRPLSPNNFLQQPVTHITLNDARAYARWLTMTASQMWVLPDEFEWEKAGRGVDGRLFPWGNRSDPSWSAMKNSYPHPPEVSVVDSWPVDESPYGVRGMSGNVKQWCANPYRQEGPRTQEISSRTLALSATGTLKGIESPLYDSFDDDTRAHALRGGAWNVGEARTRLASRRGGLSGNRYDNVGFRVIRYT